MNNRRDIMVDIETLGTKEGSSIFQIAAVSFDITTGTIHDKYNHTGDISKYDKLIVDGDTLKWWLNTNKELLTELLNKGEHSERHLLLTFASWLRDQGENVYLWGNGILFDNAKIQKAMKDYKLEYPIFYRNDRDVRTILELASMKSGLSEKELKEMVANEAEVEHDALDDCTYQIRLVCLCYDIIMNKEESE